MPGHFYTDPLVRDLAWAGFSPLLIHGPGLAGAGLELTDAWRRHLAELDRDATPLREFLGDTPGGRLGLYYERLWHYLLEYDPDTELLAHNLAVRDGHRTVGEFDCIYWCRRREKHVHLELAVKFYLGIAGTELWLGPGQHDRLDQKLHHLTARQSRLSQHPAARAVLNKLGIQDCISVVDIKGYLFAPMAGASAPEYHNPANPLRTWYTWSQFRELDPLPESWQGWQKIPRRRWLSAYSVNDGQRRGTEAMAELLASRLGHGSRPVQLAACDASGREQRRCFITPDNWPDHAPPPESQA